ncbi:hypothetical protein [Yoonia rosea]|uniref:hypothetical protein n=1 Tax=Yoonia rosea TaxID=287098 RepID=UPI001F601D46|nr:hypothetical protein [Yoonia rosea]
MTKVIPIAKNAFSATCLDMITIFAVDKKFGALKAKKANTKIRAMNVRAFSKINRTSGLDGDDGVESD